MSDFDPLQAFAESLSVVAHNHKFGDMASEMRRARVVVFVFLLVASIGLVGLAGLNLKNCFVNGVSRAYGHLYYRAETPVAFWISATCSVLGVLLGAALALAALIGLIATY